MVSYRNFPKRGYLIRPNPSHPSSERLQNTCIGFLELQSNFETIISGIRLSGPPNKYRLRGRPKYCFGKPDFPIHFNRSHPAWWNQNDRESRKPGTVANYLDQNFLNISDRKATPRSQSSREILVIGRLRLRSGFNHP